jgi:hypothetical protein
VVVVDELRGCQVPDGTVRPFFVVLSSSGFNHELRFLSRQKPGFIETFIPKLAVDAFDEGILDELLRLSEVQMHPCCIAQASKAVPANSGPLSRIKVSGNCRVANSRFRIRHTCVPPINTSTSITDTSFE